MPKTAAQAVTTGYSCAAVFGPGEAEGGVDELREDRDGNEERYPSDDDSD